MCIPQSERGMGGILLLVDELSIKIPICFVQIGRVTQKRAAKVVPIFEFANIIKMFIIFLSFNGLDK